MGRPDADSVRDRDPHFVPAAEEPPMENRTPHLDTLLELETRHEDLLQRLDELDKKVEKVLKQCQASRREEVADDESPCGEEFGG